MHIDDVMKMLGFEEKKQIVPRLYTLQSEGKVERLNGQKWRVMPIAGTESGKEWFLGENMVTVFPSGKTNLLST